MAQLPECTPSGRLVNVLRWVSFVVAYVAVAIAFSMFASTVFLNAIKEQFQYSQSQGKPTNKYISQPQYTKTDRCQADANNMP